MPVMIDKPRKEKSILKIYYLPPLFPSYQGRHWETHKEKQLRLGLAGSGDTIS